MVFALHVAAFCVLSESCKIQTWDRNKVKKTKTFFISPFILYRFWILDRFQRGGGEGSMAVTVGPTYKKLSVNYKICNSNVQMNKVEIFS